MKIRSDLLIRTLGFCASGAIETYMPTLDYKVAYYETHVDPAFVGDGRNRLYIFWHEYMQFFIYLRRNCNLAMLLSRHSDADILEKVAHQFGFGTVRGSTARGGAAAIREMMKKADGENWHLTITPDGPRGPRRKMAPGAVFLASKLGMPLVPLGVGYDRPWRTPTWDRFAVPRPGTRARLIAGPEVLVPPDLDRTGIDHYTRKIERLMNRLTEMAEDWAEKGYRIEGASDMSAGPHRSILHFSRPKPAARSVESADFPKN